MQFERPNGIPIFHFSPIDFFVWDIFSVHAGANHNRDSIRPRGTLARPSQAPDEEKRTGNEHG